MRRAARVLTSIALLAVSRQALAQGPATVPVHIDYEGRAGCPDASTFTRALGTRAPHALFTSVESGAKVLVVRFRTPAKGGGLDGVLVAQGGAERVVHGQSCGEVVAALAVIASVVVESDSAPAETESSDAETHDAPKPAVVNVMPRREPDTSWPVEEPPAPPPPPRPWTFSFGAGVGAASGASPTVLASVDGFVELSRSFGGVLEPAARLRFQRTAIGGSDRIGGGARFALTTGGSDICPVAIHTSGLRAQACLRGEGGELDASGNGVEPARSEARPWFALGPVARLRLDVGGPFFAELEGAVLGLFVRDRFFVEPNTLVYRPPAIAGSGSFGLGVAFR